MINWQASNRFDSAQSTTMTLLANGQKVVEKPISFIGEESISGNLSWLPDNEGEIEFEVILGKVNGRPTGIIILKRSTRALKIKLFVH